MQAGNIELGEALVRAGPGDARRIGDITAEAFRNDPFNLWLFGKFAGTDVTINGDELLIVKESDILAVFGSSPAKAKRKAA